MQQEVVKRNPRLYRGGAELNGSEPPLRIAMESGRQT